MASQSNAAKSKRRKALPKASGTDTDTGTGTEIEQDQDKTASQTISQTPDTANFKQMILAITHSIPAGKVATYGQLAALAGIPRAARMAGSALKDLPNDTRIPWHRVINAQGKLSLPPSHPSYRRQQQRLKAEGVLLNNGRIDLKHYQWEP